ncbi:MAG: GH32 C-terminal domain-containing protein, partial [Clostridia bacterium]|nr:GH32 C-terminal domain-containing protein [Clostridia bacterium]
QGAHWDCVVMLPITTKDGSQTKYILFDCPQYTVDGYVVDCYYWIGTFDKNACRFIADDPKPRLFDRGRGIYTGQNGYCFLTEEDIANGKTSYEQGRTVLYAIAQGKDAGTDQNYYAGWAHNFAIPLELYLTDDGKDVLREPIKEMQSLREETLYTYTGEGKTASEINAEIANIRGDMLEIDATFTLAPTGGAYKSGISVRYNPTQNMLGTERTHITFDQTGVFIDRLQSSLYDHVAKQPGYTWANTGRRFEVKILLDRSMLEVFVNGEMSFTTRVYPKYGDSDYLRVFDENAGAVFTEFTVRRLGSAYSDTVTPAYYGNTGNLADAGV